MSPAGSVTMTEAVDTDPDAEGVIYTRGIGSVVYDNRGDEIGHVSLIDCDSTTLHSVIRLAREMDGFRAVFRSSVGSYHLWELRPRSLTSVCMDALSIRLADPEHIAQSRRRDSFVLRAAPKVHGDGSVYKAAPKLIGVFDDGESKVARGHYQVVKSHGCPTVDPDRLAGGEGIQTHRYMSLTDAAKGGL